MIFLSETKNSKIRKLELTQTHSPSFKKLLNLPLLAAALFVLIAIVKNNNNFKNAIKSQNCLIVFSIIDEINALRTRDISVVTLKIWMNTS